MSIKNKTINLTIEDPMDILPNYGISSLQLTKEYLLHTQDFPLGQIIMGRIYEAIEKAERNLGEDEYGDNYRVAIKGDNILETFYEAEKDFGCCGRIDSTIIINGLEIKYGFNYGH